MIKVLHINLHDKKHGIGSNARLLHETLLTRGIESQLWVSEVSPEQPGYRIFALAQEAPAQADGLLNGDLIDLFGKCDLMAVDVIHLHLAGKCLSPLLLPFLQVKPVVLSLDDCSWYTAGCSHSAHCGQWQTAKCGDCPIYRNDPRQSAKQQELFSLKENLYQTQKFQVVCLTEWQKAQVAQSILKHNPIRVLPRLYDREAFYPGSQAQSRANLGLAAEYFTLFVHGHSDPAIAARIKDLVVTAVGKIRRGGTKIAIVYYGADVFLADHADMVRNLAAVQSSFLLGEYYRACDLNLYFDGLDQAYAAVIEAKACLLPSVVFDLGAAREVVSETTGFVIPSFDEESLASCFQQYLRDSQVAIDLRDALKNELQSAGTSARREEKYIALYEVLSGKSGSNDECQPLYLVAKGWPEVDAFLEEKIKKSTDEIQKKIYIDQFFEEIFAKIDIEDDHALIWEAIKRWLNYRKVGVGIKFRKIEERQAHLAVCTALRQRLVDYFAHMTLEQFKALTIDVNNIMIKLWRELFLNVNAVLHSDAVEYACPAGALSEEESTGYPLFLVKSMYVPYPDDNSYAVDISLLLHSGLPVAQKVIIMLWLSNAPLYSGTEFNRQQVLDYVERISQTISKNLDIVSPALCMLLIESFVLSLWRISYLGGNNIKALSAYGDFIRSNVKFRYPEFCKPIKPRKRKRGEKLRIGYISVNFRNQAVSQYMANRFIHHDRDKFFVKTFILKRYTDEMTETIKSHSDASVEFENLLDFAGIAKTVKESKLDMLIFADIGMDILTYTLGAMNLAPKQAVLVGHGTTTGLRNLDYYISGDHEPDNAQEHYVEKLIRLPQAGAAQLPPSKNESTLTRKEVGVPDDAVMFISCANGIKFYYNRDELFIEILKKAPNAYVVLKPFQSPDAVDFKLMNRIKDKAKAAGVEKRLVVLAPLPHPGDLMGLLTLADVQLDTYPYGGWTTNLEAIYYHLPVVTQEGDIARSRWGAALLRAIGITEGIAADEAQYVEWAVKFAGDRALRERVKATIKAAAPDVLFNGAKAQPAYEAALIDMINEKRK